jgi:glycosyltransferase involved in cell wall biosynthesis
LKILYASFSHDPRVPDAASGADHQFLLALQQGAVDVHTCGPVVDDSAFLERGIRRLYRSFTGKRYLKYTVSRTWRAGRLLNSVTGEHRPDVVFSLFPAPLVHYRGAVPCVLRVDTTFQGYQDLYPEYGNLALALSKRQERRALSKCSRVITHSDWCKRDLVENYGFPGHLIDVFPNPAALPNEVLPSSPDVRTLKPLAGPVRLLLVGRDYRRKAVDVGLAVIEALNAAGIDSRLVVAGLNGPSDDRVTFAGLFKKSDRRQLVAYTTLLSEAHFLIHPARFDPSPIVTSEAAAFCTPTITHHICGLPTSVMDGVSGLVLPANSDATAYVKAISGLVRQPEEYYSLCESTRRRFDRELNWDVAGRRLIDILKTAEKRSPVD